MKVSESAYRVRCLVGFKNFFHSFFSSTVQALDNDRLRMRAKNSRLSAYGIMQERPGFIGFSASPADFIRARTDFAVSPAFTDC